jgi:hypothetical protein
MENQEQTHEGKTEGRIVTEDKIDPFLRRDSISRTPPGMSRELEAKSTPITVSDGTPEERKATENSKSDDNGNSDDDKRRKTEAQQRLTDFYSLNPNSSGKEGKKEDLTEDEEEEWELKTPPGHSRKRKKKNSPRVPQPTVEISAAMLSLQTKIDKMADFCRTNQNVHRELKNLAKEIRSINRTVIKEAKEEKMDWRERESRYLQYKHDLKREVANLRRTEEEWRTRHKPEPKETGVQTEVEDGPRNVMGKGIKTYETTGTQTYEGDVENEMRKEKIKEIMANGGNVVELHQVAKEKWPESMYTHTQRTNVHPLKQGDEASVFLVVDKEATKGNIIINKICETHRGFKKMIDEGRLERGTIICSKSVNTTQILDATQEDEEEAATRRCYIIGTDSSQDDVGTWKDAVGAAKKVIKIMQKSGIQRTVITTIRGSSEQWRKAVECIASGRDVKIDINSNDVPKEEGWQQTGIRKKKPKTWETKRPTTEAIVVKTQGKPYAEMLKEVREKIDVGHIGVELTSVRKTKQGDLLMVVKKKEGAGEKLRSEIGKKIDNVKVNSPKSGRAFIHVKDIDELSTEKEIIEALQKALNLKNDTESIRPAFGCTQVLQ